MRFLASWHSIRWPVAVSLIAHVALIAWLATGEPRSRDAMHTAADLIEIEIPAMPYQGKELVPRATAQPQAEPAGQPLATRPQPGVAADAPTTASTAQPARTTRVPTRTQPHPAALAAPASSGSAASAAAPGQPSGSPSGKLALSTRGAAQPRETGQPDAQQPAGPPGLLDLSPERVARLAEPDLGPTPPPSPLELPGHGNSPEQRSELVPDGDGTYRADDLVFTAKIGRDGRVEIKDQPNLRITKLLPTPGGVRKHLEDWTKDPYGTAIEDERAVETGTVTIVGGSFDLTDWIMRSSGQDPYSRRKALFLDRTRKERAKLSAAERASVLRESLLALPRLLDKLWSDTSLPPAERRRLIFELWDECIERGPEDEVNAGARARATILAFIRRTLPQGSEHAYREDELRALDGARKSEQHFAPYP